MRVFLNIITDGAETVISAMTWFESQIVILEKHGPDRAAPLRMLDRLAMRFCTSYAFVTQ
jgi:hypothetical protein